MSLISTEENLSIYAFSQKAPQAVPLEDAILGALMLDKEAIYIMAGILKVEHFYDRKNAKVFAAIMQLYNQSFPIDLLSVTEELKRSGELKKVGGPVYIVELTNKVASAANIEYHARIVVQKYIKRAIVQSSLGLVKKAYDDTYDALNALELMQQNAIDIAEGISKGSDCRIASIGQSFLKKWEHILTSDGVSGVPTGLTEFDELTGGFQNGDLVVLAARPGMGKTALILGCAKSAAQAGIAVAIFSLEMPKDQLMLRMACSEAGISGSKLRTKQIDYNTEWPLIAQAVEELSALPILIEDASTKDLQTLRVQAKRFKVEHDIKIIFIDYIQLMQLQGKKYFNREQEMSDISKALKGLATELDIPIVPLAQLSRAVEQRGGTKRPQLSDLRESGQIEQDSDIVSFIYRPEYYDILEDEEGNSLVGVAEIIVAKNRHGSLRTIKTRFNSDLVTFSDMEDEDFLDSPTPPSMNMADYTVIKPSKMNDEDVPF